jgi:hypothetical protein
MAVAYLWQYNASAQLIKKRFYYDNYDSFCSQGYSFYDSIAFYDSGCELNFQFIGAFRYRQQNDSLILTGIPFSRFPLLKKVSRRTLPGRSGVDVEIYDIENKKLHSTSLYLFKRRKGRDSLLGTFSSFTSEQVKKYRNPKKYYWTLKNVFPFYNNEFTLSFSFDKPYNLYRIYFNAPWQCLEPADTKTWITMNNVLRIYTSTLLTSWGYSEVRFFETYK